MTAEDIFEQNIKNYIGIGYTKPEIIKAMQEYARIKCLEAIKNTRHKACEIVLDHQDSQFDVDRILNFIERDIQNIPDKEIMPEL